MTMLNHAATGDDNLLDQEEKDEYRDVQSKQIMSLSRGENIDIDEGGNGISISDLGLTEFRMDAVEFMKTYGEPNRVPKGMHAVVQKDEDRGIVPGVIFVLKNHNESVKIKSQNLLHPYYLVYLDNKGETVNTHLQVKQVLDTVRIASKGKTEPIDRAFKKFNAETDDGLKMGKYNKLLGDAVSTIIETKGESDIMDILKGNTDALKDGTMKGLDDFELIAFVVVK